MPRSPSLANAATAQNFLPTPRTMQFL